MDFKIRNFVLQVLCYFVPIVAPSCVLWSMEENFLLLDDATNEIVFELGSRNDERITPCSTFKIALSLMGFDAEILKDENLPVWAFREGYVDYLESWKAPQNPQSWMKNSCVWYSQVLTPQLGLEKIEKYLKSLEYGNQDMCGGLTKAWLSSSLKISPKEQVRFIQKMVHGELPISKQAIETTKSILFVDALPGGWKLFGKTGMGSITEPEGKNLQVGWFVGWIERNEEIFLFAYNIRDQKIMPSERIPRVKQLLEEQLTLAQDAHFIIEKRELFDEKGQRTIPIQIYKPSLEEVHECSVVIVNHGYSVENTEYKYIAEPLCRKGYFVVSIQHDLLGDPELPRMGNLFALRKPFWERGVQNILFVMSEMERVQSNLNLKKVILIGHSNGGDISMLFAATYPQLVAKVISLDSLRIPFPTKDHIPILTLRANDTQADEGVLPMSGVSIVELKNTKHIDMYDRGPEEVKQEITSQIARFLKASL